MRGHLVIFAKVLGSNQVLWDSFSPLEESHKDEIKCRAAQMAQIANKTVKKLSHKKYYYILPSFFLW